MLLSVFNGKKKSKFSPGKRNYNTKDLNNKSLEKVVNRMRLESQYSELNKKATSDGKKFINEVLKNSVRVAAGLIVTAAGNHIIKKTLSNK